MLPTKKITPAPSTTAVTAPLRASAAPNPPAITPLLFHEQDHILPSIMQFLQEYHRRREIDHWATCDELKPRFMFTHGQSVLDLMVPRYAQYSS
jgi:hypothetical protein